MCLHRTRSCGLRDHLRHQERICPGERCEVCHGDLRTKWLGCASPLRSEHATGESRSDLCWQAEARWCGYGATITNRYTINKMSGSVLLRWGFPLTPCAVWKDAEEKRKHCDGFAVRSRGNRATRTPDAAIHTAIYRARLGPRLPRFVRDSRCFKRATQSATLFTA